MTQYICEIHTNFIHLIENINFQIESSHNSFAYYSLNDELYNWVISKNDKQPDKK